ncbi:hypothetical protein [Methanosarcina sp.]|uniref:hypothetical protein n=1 Tax=Methanosarcina sp. TaxID=2213 RepID=UPI003C78A95A
MGTSNIGVKVAFGIGSNKNENKIRKSSMSVLARFNLAQEVKEGLRKRRLSIKGAEEEMILFLHL